MYHLLEDPKFWLLICFIVFVGLMVKPFRKSMIGGLDNKIEEIKQNINISLKSFKLAEEKLTEAIKRTENLEIRIKDLLGNAQSQSEMLSKEIINKTNSTIISKEKNSLERIRQIEVSAIQEIKFSTSVKLNKIIIGYFENMSNDRKKEILDKKITTLISINS